MLLIASSPEILTPKRPSRENDDVTKTSGNSERSIDPDCDDEHKDSCGAAFVSDLSLLSGVGKKSILHKPSQPLETKTKEKDFYKIQKETYPSQTILTT